MRVTLLAALLLLTACAPEVSVRRIDRRVATQWSDASWLDRGTLSEATRALVAAAEVPDAASPLSAQIAFAQTLPAGPTRDVALAELHLALIDSPGKATGGSALAEAIVGRIERQTLAWYAAAFFADRALDGYANTPGGWLSGRAELARRIYNHAVANLVSLAPLLQIQQQEPIPEPVEWNVNDFDRVLPTEWVAVDGIAPLYRRSAMGVPVTLVREQQEADPPRSEPHIPPEGAFYPATAMIDFSADGERATLRLWNPDYVDSIARYGTRVSLSIDTTTPIAELFARTNLFHEGQQGLIQVERYLRRMGIYLHEPYDRDKIPVLMVHGLRSSPITWRQMLNHLRAQPELRRRYQFWMFMYPTGVPIPRSAHYLRSALQAVRTEFDPNGDDANLRRMVVIGHSMGGLVSKAQVQDSGTQLWDSLHPEPFEQINANEEVRQHLREVFFYEADPDIARMIFIASPHRGSPMAGSSLGRFGDSLVQLPPEFRGVEAWIEQEARRLPDDPRYQFSRGVPSSIDDLREDAPHMRAYLALPLRSGLPIHNIIGNAEGDSDGVVPVSSARLAGVTSELVVPANHDAHTHPKALREVERILRLHLEAD